MNEESIIKESYIEIYKANKKQAYIIPKIIARSPRNFS